MKVKDLIADLQQYDPEMIVQVTGGDEEFHQVSYTEQTTDTWSDHRYRHIDPFPVIRVR